MNVKEFKNIVNSALTSNGLLKKGRYYYSTNEDLIISVGIQESKFNNGCYINVGYILKQLNPALEFPKDTDGDIRTRFSIADEGKSVDLFDLEKMERLHKDVIEKSIVSNIKDLIQSVNSLDGLRALIRKHPAIFYQTKISAKQALGLG